MPRRGATHLDLDARETIMAEHRQLADLVNQLEHNADACRLPLMLDGLRTILGRHFAREEGPDGLYEVLSARADRTSVRALLGEHTTLLAMVGELNERSNDDPDAPTLLREVGRFCQVLRGHEHRESRLLIDSLSTGSHDGAS